MFKCDIKMFVMHRIGSRQICEFRSNLCVRFKRARNSIITISFEIANLIEFKLVIVETRLCFYEFREKSISATKYSNGRIFCSGQ